MSGFEFFFSFYGLLLGFSVAEVTGGLASAINLRQRVRLGWLTPLLSVFIMIDIMSFWLFAWANREGVTIGWSSMTSGLFVAVTYYLAASLVYPKDWSEYEDLDQHYWAQKRLIVAGLALTNLVVLCYTLVRFPAQLTDWSFFFWQSLYWVPLIGLLFTRSTKLDIALLLALIGQYLLFALNLFPRSSWGAAIGI